MAAKDNASASEIDKTSFWWAGLCAICHPGGGPAEYDRDGELFYDVATSQFGYEKLGLNSGDVTLDGDYAEVNHMTGALRNAPWDKTGVAEADCLFCHRADRVINTGMNMNWIWRAGTLRAKDNLVDDNTDPVMAFAAASTAGQGWFSNFATAAGVKPPLATTLQIDYQTGVDNGSLIEDASGNLKVAPTAIVESPVDYACWGCHITPDLKKRGRTWFDETKDVHYAGFNLLADGDPGNDVAPENSAACTRCHPSGEDHNIAKGNATLGSVRDDTDYTGFRTCRDCHEAGSPFKDPQAPEPSTSVIAHTISQHDVMSCEFCHIPYKHDPADLFVDNATTGATMGYNTAAFLSDDPLNPGAAGDTKWYPAFEMKSDKGTMRLFPTKLLLSAWWGDWIDQGTIGTLDAGDVIKPIALWRVRQITAGAPLGVVTDDNADTKPEVNSTAEIIAYIAALQGNDSYGNPVAVKPVLVKGGKIWFDSGGGVLGTNDYHGTGVKVESSHPFSINHNVLQTSEALGAGGIPGCADCHGGSNTPVFDRLILVDPFGEDGQPVFETVRQMTGVSPN